MSVYGPIADAAEELRDVLQAGFLARETAGGPAAPQRILMTEGVPVVEFCDQLAIYVEAVRMGLAGAAVPSATINEATATLVVVDLAALVTRCAAPMGQRGEAPAVAAMEASARTVNSDAHVLLASVLEAVSNDTLWSTCTRAAIGEVRGIEASGGAVGFLLRMTLTL